MIDTHIRPLIQDSIFIPAARLLAQRKLNPNILTAAGLISGILIAPLVALGYSLIALCLLMITGYLDIIDGTVARLLNRASPKGTVYDITSDRIVEFAILFGLYLYAPQERALLTILMLGSILVCITTFLVVSIFSANESEKSFHYSVGLMERSEAFLLFALMIVWPTGFPIVATVFTALVTATAAIRVYEFSRQ
ncbi:Inner membrane protein YnjF [Chlamydiales bacterium SCGC AG-110-P3]|nr:Inner membrane protein YnjF [Chlamydiales bacterium SCGC AG-110-P3]